MDSCFEQMVAMKGLSDDCPDTLEYINLESVQTQKFLEKMIEAIQCTLPVALEERKMKATGEESSLSRSERDEFIEYFKLDECRGLY